MAKRIKAAEQFKLALTHKGFHCGREEILKRTQIYWNSTKDTAYSSFLIEEEVFLNWIGRFKNNLVRKLDSSFTKENTVALFDCSFPLRKSQHYCKQFKDTLVFNDNQTQLPLPKDTKYVVVINTNVLLNNLRPYASLFYLDQEDKKLISRIYPYDTRHDKFKPIVKYTRNSHDFHSSFNRLIQLVLLSEQYNNIDTNSALKETLENVPTDVSKNFVIMDVLDYIKQFPIGGVCNISTFKKLVTLLATDSSNSQVIFNKLIQRYDPVLNFNMFRSLCNDLPKGNIFNRCVYDILHPFPSWAKKQFINAQRGNLSKAERYLLVFANLHYEEIYSEYNKVVKDPELDNFNDEEVSQEQLQKTGLNRLERCFYDSVTARLNNTKECFFNHTYKVT